MDDDREDGMKTVQSLGIEKKEATKCCTFQAWILDLLCELFRLFFSPRLPSSVFVSR